jgi:hypothetical protein
LKPFLDIFKIALVALLQHVVWKCCHQSCLFSEGTKRRHKALDLGSMEGGDTLNAFTCQKLNDNVQNMWSGIVMMKHSVSNKLRSFF